MQNLSQKGYLFPGAAELCRSLSRVCRLYIVTNGVEFIQKGRFEKCEIRNCFSGLFISGEIGFEKPNVKYFERAAEKIENFDKNKTLIVGDSLTADIAGGIGFGIGTCWYNPNGKPLPEGIKIDCNARTYDEIYDFITER
jgi:2-haloacid dehalogenase